VAIVAAHREALFADHEAELVPALAALSVEDTAAAMRVWAERADAIVDRPPPLDRPRQARLSQLLDGRGRLDADLDPTGLQVVAAGLEAASCPDGAGESRSPGQRRADALVDVFRFFLDYQPDHGADRNRPHLNLVVD